MSSVKDRLKYQKKELFIEKIGSKGHSKGENFNNMCISRYTAIGVQRKKHHQKAKGEESVEENNFLAIQCGLERQSCFSLLSLLLSLCSSKQNI
jgi:hypothetical protein